MAEMFTRR